MHLRKKTKKNRLNEVNCTVFKKAKNSKMAKNSPHILRTFYIIKQAMTMKIYLQDSEILVLAYNKKNFIGKLSAWAIGLFVLSIIVTIRFL